MRHFEKGDIAHRQSPQGIQYAQVLGDVQADGTFAAKLDGRETRLVAAQWDVYKRARAPQRMSARLALYRRYKETGYPIVDVEYVTEASHPYICYWHDHRRRMYYIVFVPRLADYVTCKKAEVWMDSVIRGQRTLLNAAWDYDVRVLGVEAT